MKWRKSIVAISTCLVAGVAYVATSSALTSHVLAVPSDTSAAQLPTSALPTSDQVSVFDLIGQSPAGISAQSLDNVGVLGTTAAGTLYVVPGSTGLCVVLLGTEGTPAASCGDPSDGPVSVYAQDPATSNWVGGGVYSLGATPSITRADGSTFTPNLVPGGFTVGAADDLPADASVKLGVK